MGTVQRILGPAEYKQTCVTQTLTFGFVKVLVRVLNSSNNLYTTISNKEGGVVQLVECMLLHGFVLKVVLACTVRVYVS